MSICDDNPVLASLQSERSSTIRTYGATGNKVDSSATDSNEVNRSTTDSNEVEGSKADSSHKADGSKADDKRQ